MKGFELYNGNQDFRILDGARTVLTTEGKLINLLPSSSDINLTFNVDFPDFTKDYQYNYRHSYDGPLGGLVNYTSGAVTQLTIPPQDFADEANLVAAPTSSDIFVGAIVMSRTASPSHSWGGSSIDPLQPAGVRIPFISGSVLAEAEFGMARAFSIYVAGGQLKLHRQQSVSVAPGGWGGYGEVFNFTLPGRQTSGGGENSYGSVAGIPVAPGSIVGPLPNVEFGFPYPARDQRAMQGGPNSAPLPNPAAYNYSSTYQVNLTGAFGRRS